MQCCFIKELLVKREVMKQPSRDNKSHSEGRNFLVTNGWVFHNLACDALRNIVFLLAGIGIGERIPVMGVHFGYSDAMPFFKSIGD
jgi:hypothetical protein